MMLQLRLQLWLRLGGGGGGGGASVAVNAVNGRQLVVPRVGVVGVGGVVVRGGE
jgi:hypothetical protein